MIENVISKKTMYLIFAIQFYVLYEARDIALFSNDNFFK